MELLGRIFSAGFLRGLFTRPPGEILSGTAVEDSVGELYADPDNISRIHALGNKYVSTVDSVMAFLRGQAPELAELICMPEYLPQAGRFAVMADPVEYFGTLGTADCAKYLATLYLEDLGDYIRATVTTHFGLARYAEKIAVSVPEFAPLTEELSKPADAIDREMYLLLEGYIDKYTPEFIGFTIPFPGNLLAALKCARFIKAHHPEIKTIAGGGYPTTELRSLSETAVFDYFDHIILDDGEATLERIVRGGTPCNSYIRAGYYDRAGILRPIRSADCNTQPEGDNNVNGSSTDKGTLTDSVVTTFNSRQKDNFASDDIGRIGPVISHVERGCPDFGGLPHRLYFSMLETPNPMLRLWSDGRWNKLTLAHGCYWGRCTFCDTGLDYIRRYDAVPAAVIADWMDEVSAVTGSRGFHFTDEAAPPRVLRDLSLELLRRGRNYVWWTNVRFDKAFSGDLCRLMAAAGCIAVSGGLETASDRLLTLMDKGISIESATLAMRNFLYSGIMVHGYLMYGFPTQTLQETVDSLEVVRQMFRAGLLESAHWHRYAMTVHSPSGQKPEDFGIKSYDRTVNPFANNEIYFRENRNYDIRMAGKALRTALTNYMAGAGLDRLAHKWFGGKTPATTLDDTLITDHLIKADPSRMFDAEARLLWVAPSLPSPTEDGIIVEMPAKTKNIRLTEPQVRFVMRLTEEVDGLSARTTLGLAREIFEEINGEGFLAFYHSKKWDALRECGLLQI